MATVQALPFYKPVRTVHAGWPAVVLQPADALYRGMQPADVAGVAARTSPTFFTDPAGTVPYLSSKGAKPALCEFRPARPLVLLDMGATETFAALFASLQRLNSETSIAIPYIHSAETADAYIRGNRRGFAELSIQPSDMILLISLMFGVLPQGAHDTGNHAQAFYDMVHVFDQHLETLRGEGRWGKKLLPAIGGDALYLNPILAQYWTAERMAEYTAHMTATAAAATAVATRTAAPLFRCSLYEFDMFVAYWLAAALRGTGIDGFYVPPAPTAFISPTYPAYSVYFHEEVCLFQTQGHIVPGPVRAIAALRFSPADAPPATAPAGADVEAMLANIGLVQTQGQDAAIQRLMELLSRPTSSFPRNVLSVAEEVYQRSKDVRLLALVQLQQTDMYHTLLEGVTDTLDTYSALNGWSDKVRTAIYAEVYAMASAMATAYRVDLAASLSASALMLSNAARQVRQTTIHQALSGLGNGQRLVQYFLHVALQPRISMHTALLDRCLVSTGYGMRAMIAGGSAFQLYTGGPAILSAFHHSAIRERYEAAVPTLCAQLGTACPDMPRQPRDFLTLDTDIKIIGSAGAVGAVERDALHRQHMVTAALVYCATDMLAKDLQANYAFDVGAMCHMLARTGVETRYSAYIASHLPAIDFSVGVNPGLQQYFGLVVEQHGLAPVTPAARPSGPAGPTGPAETNARAIEEWEKAMRRSIAQALGAPFDEPAWWRTGYPRILAHQRATIAAQGRTAEWKLLWDTYQTFAAAYMAQRLPGKRTASIPFHYSDMMSVLITNKPRAAAAKGARKGTRSAAVAAAAAAATNNAAADPYGSAWTEGLVDVVVHTEFARQFAVQPWEPVGAVLQPVYFPNADRLPVPVAAVPVSSFQSLEQSMRSMVHRCGTPAVDDDRAAADTGINPRNMCSASVGKLGVKWTKYVHRCAMLDLVAAMCSAGGQPFDRAGGSRRLVAIMTCIRHGYLPYSTEAFAAAWARLAGESDDQPMEELVHRVVGTAPPVFSAMVG
jgi:hypothetical protein